MPDDIRSLNPIHESHPYSKFACTTCHKGDGRSLAFNFVHDAKYREFADAKLDIVESARSSCTACHTQRYLQASFDGADEGRILAARLGCAECHVIPSILEEPERLDLMSLVQKLRANYLYSLLRQKDPLLTVTRSMPYFKFTAQDAADLISYLDSLPIYRPIPLFDPSLYTYQPEDVERGRAEFDRLGCAKCHVTPNFPSGGDDGPVLTNLGYRVNKRWLVWWFDAPRDLRPFSEMPVYSLEDKSIKLLTAYLTAVAGEDPYSEAKPEGNPTNGALLFDKNNCLACHTTDGSSIERKHGADLAGLASRNPMRIPFRDMPSNSNLDKSAFSRLDLYLSRVHSFSGEVDRDIAMPDFRLPARYRTPLVRFLLSLRRDDLGQFASSEPFRQATDRGEILFSRKYCFRCHSTVILPEDLTRQVGKDNFARIMGPNLSRIGEKVRLGWFEDFLMHPEKTTARIKMPNPMLSPRMAADLSAYLRGMQRSPSLLEQLEATKTEMPPGDRVSRKAGEELFIGKGCFKCHVVDGQGVHMGPDLSNVGVKLTPEFTVRWLFRAGDIQPDTDMDDIYLTPSEALLVYRYLSHLRNRPK